MLNLNFSHSDYPLWAAYTEIKDTDEVIRVAIIVDGTSVAFTVNGEFVRRGKAPRVAITRWLLKQLETLKEEFSVLTCSAYAEDGQKELREGIYRRVGFRPFGSEEVEDLEAGDALVWERNPGHSLSYLWDMGIESNEDYIRYLQSNSQYEGEDDPLLAYEDYEDTM